MASNAGGIEVSKHEEIPVSHMQLSDYVKPKPLEARSETSLQSGLSSLNPGYEILKILEWLAFVDGHIEKSSINIMTLGLYEITQRAIESNKMDRVSDVYHLLTAIMDPNEALTRFLYALEKLGRKRRGVYCVTHFERIVGIMRPSTHDYDIRVLEERKFAFYQVLVKICIRLEEDRNTSKRVRTYACRHVVGSATLKTVADLFLKMLDAEDLTVDDQGQLALVLGIIGENSCLEMLQNYRTLFKMDEIEWEQIQPKQRMQNIEPPSASNSTLNTISTDRSSESSLPPSDRGYPMESPTPGNTPTINGHPSATISGNHEGERTHLLQGPHPPAVAHRHHHHHHHHRAQQGRSWKVWAVFSGLLLLSLLLVGTGLTMISLAAVTKSDVGGTVTLYKNTTAALANVQTFSTSRVTLRQSPETGEVNIPITFYRIKKNCNNLDSKDYDSPAENNVSISIPATLVNNYLLPDSIIDYTICAVTNNENYTQYHVDYFILERLDEDFSFNTDSSNFLHHSVINITYGPDFQQPKNCFKPIVEYKVRKRSYYSVLISPPPLNEIPSNNLRIWYSKRNKLNVISLQKGNKKCQGSSYYTFKIGTLEHTIGHYCLVAEVGDTSNDPYTHVEIDSYEWTPGKIMFYAFGGFSVLVGVVLATAVAIVIMKCRFQREANPAE